MNHSQLCMMYQGWRIEIGYGRVVRILGASVPGIAFCEASDGGPTISEVPTAYLHPSRLRKERFEHVR